MNKTFKILIVVGIFVGLFSALIPFADYFSNKWENRIYFRGILLGFLLVSVGSAAIFKDYYQNAFISLGSGVFALLFMSSLNLVFDGLIETYNYFKWTFIIVFINFILITIIRLWLSKVLAFFDYLSSLRLLLWLLAVLSAYLGKLKKSMKNLQQRSM